MTNLETPIGLFGGSFDPIHYGHLHIAEEALKQFPLAQIHFIPCKIPVMKAACNASAADRSAMIQLAIQHEPKFILNTIEIDRALPSYTIQILIELRRYYPTTPFQFIVGMDAFASFCKWHRYDEILNYTHIMVMQRPNYTLPKDMWLYDLLGQRLQHDPRLITERLGGWIYFPPISEKDISSSDIREKIQQQASTEKMLPVEVQNYIQQHHLYQTVTR